MYLICFWPNFWGTIFKHGVDIPAHIPDYRRLHGSGWSPHVNGPSWSIGFYYLGSHQTTSHIQMAPKYISSSSTCHGYCLNTSPSKLCDHILCFKKNSIKPQNVALFFAFFLQRFECVRPSEVNMIMLPFCHIIHVMVMTLEVLLNVVASRGVRVPRRCITGKRWGRCISLSITK